MIELYRHNGSSPASLPPIAYDPDGNAFTAPYEPDDMAMLGIVLAPPRPHDTETHTVEWDAEAEDWHMVDRPPAPLVQEPQPATLGKLQFIGLAQIAGGMTDDMLVAAQENPAFKAFWIKYQMASAVERDDPITAGALDALQAGGYLPNGKAAVLQNWPVG